MKKEIFIPSKRFAYILGTILLFVLVMALPSLFGKMFTIGSMNPEMTISIGWPVSFFEVDILNMTSMPIKWAALILSLLSYILVSYCLDILISFILMSFKGPEKPEAVMIQARKAYYYYKSQGVGEAKVHDMFKQKGWKEEDIAKLR